MTDEQKACRHANLPSARTVMLPALPPRDVRVLCPDCGLPFILSTSPFAEVRYRLGPALRHNAMFSECSC
jgi:hypothetical protein